MLPGANGPCEGRDVVGPDLVDLLPVDAVRQDLASGQAVERRVGAFNMM
jgi:hypothetical protein